jgi:hypothetical protein
LEKDFPLKSRMYLAKYYRGHIHDGVKKQLTV